MVVKSEDAVRGFLSELSKEVIGENPSKDDVKVMSEMVGLDLEGFGIVKASKSSNDGVPGARIESRKRIGEKLDPKGESYSQSVNDQFMNAMTEFYNKASSEIGDQEQVTAMFNEAEQSLTSISNSINENVAKSNEKVASLEKGEALKNVVIIGKDKSGDEELQRHRKKVEKSLEATGKPYKIIGDGTKDVTPEMIRQEIGDTPIRSDAQMIFDTHGNNSRQYKGEYGEYKEQDNIDAMGEVYKNNVVETPDANSKALFCVNGCYSGTSKNPERGDIKANGEKPDENRAFDFVSTGNRRDQTYMSVNMAKTQYLIQNGDKQNFEKLSAVTRSDAGTININGNKIVGPKPREGEPREPENYRLGNHSLQEHLKGNVEEVAKASGLDSDSNPQDKSRLDKEVGKIDKDSASNYLNSFVANAINREDHTKIYAAMQERPKMGGSLVNIDGVKSEHGIFTAYQSDATSKGTKDFIRGVYDEINEQGGWDKKSDAYKTNPIKFAEAVYDSPELINQYLNSIPPELASTLIKDSGLPPEDVYQRANIDNSVQTQINSKLNKGGEQQVESSAAKNEVESAPKMKVTQAKTKGINPENLAQSKAELKETKKDVVESLSEKAPKAKQQLDKSKSKVSQDKSSVSQTAPASGLKQESGIARK